MKEYIEERAVEIAHYIIDHNATVRQTAKAFGVSKSTIHKDVTERLRQINLGGTAVGTGSTASRKYGFLVIEYLRKDPPRAGHRGTAR